MPAVIEIVAALSVFASLGGLGFAWRHAVQLSRKSHQEQKQ